MAEKRVTWYTLSEGGEGVENDLVDELPTEHAGRYGAGDGPEELGRGGLGRVLLVLDKHLGRDVARKELLSATPGAGASARFLREARVTACLEHPNIVPVYDLGASVDGRLYYTMRRIRGRTLRDAIEAAPAIDGRLALLPHFVDACHALAFAHSLGIVHRDIKPENVMVGEFGETLVVDWGLAKVRGEPEVPPGPGEVSTISGGRMRSLDTGDGLRTQYGAAIGTPAYMSPEQARGEVDKIDERSDVWSLGVMLYELLVGHPPFEGLPTATMLERVRVGDVPPIGRVTNAPPALCAIVEKCLQREPGARYADARALSRDVEAFLAGQRVAVYSYSFSEEVVRWVRAHRELVGASLVGVVACGALSAFAFWNVTAERDRAVSAEKALAVKESETRRELAASLAARAADRLDALDATTAEAYAARALALDASVEARGVLVAASSMGGPRLAWEAPVDVPCDALRVGPDDRWLACASTKVVHLWDLANGRAHHPVGHGDAYGWGFSWAPDGKRFLVGGDAIVRWIDAETGAIDHMLNNGVVAMSTTTLPSGEIVVGGEDGVVRVWDAHGKQALALPENHGDAWVVSVAVSPEGDRLASIASDKRIRLWDARTLKALPPLDEDGRGGSALAWGRGGKLASSDWIGDDDRVWLWDVTTGHPRTVRGSLAEVSATYAPPDGDYVASGAADGSVNLWRWDGALAFRLPDEAAGYAMIGATRDGERLFVSTGERVREWVIPATDGMLRGHRRQVTDVLPLDDGSVITVADDGEVIRWNPVTATPIARATIDPDGLWGVVRSGDRLVIGGRYGNVYGVDLATLAVVWTSAVGPGVYDLALGKDGTSVIVADDGGVTRVSVATGETLAKMDATTPEFIAVTHVGDDLLAAANYTGRLMIADPETLAVRSVVRPPATGLADVDGSPDGKFVATADDLGRVQVWDWARREVIHTLVHGDDPVAALAFSPDGRWLVGGAGNGRIVAWSVPEFVAVAAIPAHGTRLVNDLIFDDHGVLWSAGGDAIARPLRLDALDADDAAIAAGLRERRGVALADGAIVAAP